MADEISQIQKEFDDVVAQADMDLRTAVKDYKEKVRDTQIENIRRSILDK